jgi:hypothetical protein
VRIGLDRFSNQLDSFLFIPFFRESTTPPDSPSHLSTSISIDSTPPTSPLPQPLPQPQGACSQNGQFSASPWTSSTAIRRALCARPSKQRSFASPLLRQSCRPRSCSRRPSSCARARLLSIRTRWGVCNSTGFVTLTAFHNGTNHCPIVSDGLEDRSQVGLLDKRASLISSLIRSIDLWLCSRSRARPPWRATCAAPRARVPPRAPPRLCHAVTLLCGHPCAPSSSSG